MRSLGNLADGYEDGPGEDVLSSGRKGAARLADDYREAIKRWVAIARRMVAAEVVEYMEPAGPCRDHGGRNPACDTRDLSALAMPLPDTGAGPAGTLVARRKREQVWTACEVGALNDVAHALSSALTDIAKRHEHLALQDRYRHQAERFQALIEASAEIVWTTDSNGAVTECSPSWEAFTGRDVGDLVGFNWMDSVHPEDRSRVQRFWAEACHQRQYRTVDYRLRHHTGQWRWIHERCVPLLARDQSLEGWLGMSLDITERRETAEALRVSENRHRSLVEAISVMTWFADEDGVLQEGTGDKWCQFTGQSTADWSARRWLDVVHPEDRDRVEKLWSGRPGADHLAGYEYRLRHHTGRWRWMFERVVPLIGESSDAPRGWVGMTSDVTDHKQAVLALEDSERLLRRALKAAAMAAWTWHLRNGAFTISKLGEEVAHLGGQCDSAQSFLDGLRPADAIALEEEFKKGAAEQRSIEFICETESPSGRKRWIKISGRADRAESNLIGEEPDYIARGILQDITASKLAEERRNMLIGEIAHRGKNLLAVVQAMAGATLRDDRPIEQSKKSFVQRLNALARSQSLLTHCDWEGVPLDEIVRGEFEAYSNRAEIEMPSALLNPSSAQSISLVIHELIVNAAKYGALSNSAGRIIVRGRLMRLDDGEFLRFTWMERDGPSVRPPVSTGFGSLLVRRLVQGFDTDGTIEYRPDGLFLQIDIPLAMISPRNQDLYEAAIH